MTGKSTIGRETYNIIYMRAYDGRAAHAGVFYPKFFMASLSRRIGVRAHHPRRVNDGASSDE